MHACGPINEYANACGYSFPPAFMREWDQTMLRTTRQPEEELGNESEKGCIN
jgi:hypothetical protein